MFFIVARLLKIMDFAVKENLLSKPDFPDVVQYGLPSKRWMVTFNFSQNATQTEE